MASQLKAAITRSRRLIAEEDAAARSRLVAAYADAIEGLDAALAKLAGIPVDEMTPSQLIADARYRQLLTEAEAGFARFADDGQRVLLRAQRGAVDVAQRTAGPLMRAAAPDLLAASFTRLPEAALQELVGTLGPGSPVRAVLDGYGPRAAQTIESEFIQGIATGRNSRVIAARILSKIEGDAWRVEALARNETLRPFRAATLAVYRRHGHLLDGWAWSASLSKRTCLACVALHGRVFPLSVQFMPTHSQCRCSATPYRRGGPADNLRTGEEWFARQSEATQRAMIPKGAWDAFESGVLTLEDFIQHDMSPIWGESYRESSIASALERAERRQIRRVA